MESWSGLLQKYSDILSEMELMPSQEGSLEEDLYIETRVKSKPLAKPVEDGHLIKKVPLDVELKHIRYFMDGIQRTILIGYKEAPRYVTVVPIHFHISGAVIIEYDAQSGEHKLVEGPVYMTKVLVPSKKIMSSDFLAKYGDELEETIDVSKPSWDFAELRRKAMSKSRLIRWNLEVELLEKFLAENNTVIVVDGLIPARRSLLQNENVIGVVKEHREQYLERRDEIEVLKMDEGFRSRLSQIERQVGEDKYPIYFFYLKLHKINPDPFHGLVRVELNPKISREIDAISATIYDLRDPIATATIAWDRKIYPIYLCEQYLKSNCPNIEVIRAGLMGL
jgi:hypothetical protein